MFRLNLAQVQALEGVCRDPDRDKADADLLTCRRVDGVQHAIEGEAVHCTARSATKNCVNALECGLTDQVSIGRLPLCDWACCSFYPVACLHVPEGCLLRYGGKLRQVQVDHHVL